MREWDTSELDALAQRQRTTGARLGRVLRPVTERAGVQMKDQMQRAAKGHAHLPGLERFVEYEVDEQPDGLSVDVGFLHPSGIGHLENVAVFGTVRNAPVMDITAPLRDELPRFIRWATQVARDAL